MRASLAAVGLARTLQADQHDHRGRMRGRRQAMAAAAEQLDQLVVDDLHHLLGGRERLEDVLADGPLAHALHEAAHDLEVDVGFQQGHAHLAQRFLDIVLAQPAAAAQPVEDRL